MGGSGDGGTGSGSGAWPWAFRLPLGPRAAKLLRASGGGGGGGGESGDEDDRAFDLADCAEKGLARELEVDFTYPVRRSTRLWRFQVHRSEDMLQYRLVAEDGSFLMHARVGVVSEARGSRFRVDFSLYDPEKDGEPCSLQRPAFVMLSSTDGTEWRLLQERCERCQLSPRSKACACRGKQQIANIVHSQRRVGGGIVNYMDLAMPGLQADGSPVVWCPLLGRGDLGPREGSSEVHEVLRLASRMPAWDPALGSLTLDFAAAGRREVTASPRNFQLAAAADQPPPPPPAAAAGAAPGTAARPQEVLCQYGKLGPSTFALDIRYPLSVVQAFGAALTTLMWA